MIRTTNLKQIQRFKIILCINRKSINYLTSGWRLTHWVVFRLVPKHPAFIYNISISSNYYHFVLDKSCIFLKFVKRRRIFHRKACLINYVHVFPFQLIFLPKECSFCLFCMVLLNGSENDTCKEIGSLVASSD